MTPRRPTEGPPDRRLEDGPGSERPASGGREAEHALIRRAQAGDESAFEALVRLHQRLAISIAKNLVASEEDARDLAQEAFLRVFRNLARFDFEHPFATWLHRIVTNLAIDHLRKRRAVVAPGRGEDGEEQPLDIPDDDQPAPSERVEALETALEVREVIDSLAPHFQTVLVLRELEGLPCTEIAEIVGATHVTVRWRLHRGRKLFQEEWERRQRVCRHPKGGAEGRTGPAAAANSEGASP
jgi:RNA polymerase sigma-70 factor (ECF subfamily)